MVKSLYFNYKISNEPMIDMFDSLYNVMYLFGIHLMDEMEYNDKIENEDNYDEQTILDDTEHEEFMNNVNSEIMFELFVVNVISFYY